MTRRVLITSCLLALALTACRKNKAGDEPAPPVVKPVEGQVVWVVDDGERVARKAGAVPWMTGERNAVWKPGQPVRLFGLPGETIAFQVVVTAAKERIDGVTVDLPALSGPATVKNEDGPALFRPIERFVVHELAMSQRSGGKTKGESLGWKVSSMPEDPSRGGTVPDPLIPVELAPAWADYPMTVSPGEHRVVWVDVTLPSKGLPAGVYRGNVDVRTPKGPLADIAVELEVGPVALPHAAVATMVYVEPDRGIASRMGSRKAVDHLLQLMHRHHLSTVLPLMEESDVLAYRGAHTGQLYTREHGYEGPGEGKGASVVALGSYGGYGEPLVDKLGTIRRTLEALATLGIRDEPGKRDIFLYAADEQCDSAVGPGWRKLLDGSGDKMLASLRVGHTCSEPPAKQGVDLVMMIASAYDPALVDAARSSGKRVWIYNGELPHTGSFLTDAWHASLRANGWIQQKHDIERWFYWESVFWTDGNRGGHGPYDPLVTAETFHNAHGDHCNGDGVLVYPGTQVVEGYRSLGFEGVIPSIRLKQWRRGISDAGYLQLARGVDRAAADRVVARMVPRSLREAKGGKVSWPTEGAAWTEARRELFEVVRR